MCKSSNSSEFTINSPQCPLHSSVSADLASLFLQSDIHVEQVEHSGDVYRVYARSSLPSGECPYCGAKSGRVHSRYIRTIYDLSILGQMVVITFDARYSTWTEVFLRIGKKAPACNWNQCQWGHYPQDLHRMSIPKQSQIRDISVDDWAYRKGVTYGSIIVSMETGEVIDLLGDRGAESFRQWLEEHQEVKLVSRDRCTDYSAAIAATERNITDDVQRG